MSQPVMVVQEEVMPAAPVTTRRSTVPRGRAAPLLRVLAEMVEAFPDGDRIEALHRELDEPIVGEGTDEA